MIEIGSAQEVRQEDRLDMERAKRLMAMGQMAASLAHEIRNPLGSMELYCTLLKKDLAQSPSSFQLAEQIHEGIRILDRIISNCLQFSRDIIPRRTWEETADSLFEGLLSRVAAKAEQQGVSLLFVDNGKYPIYVDVYLAEQALLNVVLNALEAYDGDGSQDREIRIESDRQRPETWQLRVIDNAPGIKESDLEQIFDPFFTTKRDGTGLGLAIVHSIAQAHGGSVSIRSRAGEGTEVMFEFPAKASR